MDDASAAERFLMAGLLDRGLETARAVLSRAVLARADMTLPTTRVQTIAGIVWNQLRMRGGALTRRRRDRSDARSLPADICWSIGAGLGMVDTLLGAYFSGRAARLALARGNTLQIARGLALLRALPRACTGLIFPDYRSMRARSPRAGGRTARGRGAGRRRGRHPGERVVRQPRAHRQGVCHRQRLRPRLRERVLPRAGVVRERPWHGLGGRRRDALRTRDAAAVLPCRMQRSIATGF